MRFGLASLPLLLCAALSFAQTNLVTNPGMEGKADAGLPVGWDTVMIGNLAEFVADPQVKHGGSQSLRITAADSARSYFRSAPISVAPGEKVKASAWVKFKDVPEKMGTVIAIAEWSGPDGRGHEVAKVDVAQRSGTSSDWQHIQGTLTVPQNTANLRLRLGFSYSQGTCWWDDVSVVVETPISVRIDLPTPRVTPAMAGVPIVILNRQAIKGPAKVAITAGNDSAAFDIKLTGAPEQRMNVPLPLGKQKGKVKIEIKLTTADGKSTAANLDSQVPPPMSMPPVTPTHWCVEDGPAHVSGVVNLAAPPVYMDDAIMTVSVVDVAGKTLASKQWATNAGTLLNGLQTPFDFTVPAARQGEYKIKADFKSKETKLSAEQPWGVISRKQAKTTINDAGFLVHDGNVIWPMGIFNGGRFKEQGEAGFTVSHAYNAVRITPGRDPEDQTAKNFLDQSIANHQLVLCMVPLKLAEEGDWDGFRRRIRLFKNHPALLAWDEEEGLARGDWKKETLATAYKVVREEDPNHPFMVGDSRDVITKMGDRSNFFPVDQMDLGMWWWYPFPLTGRGANALEGEEASSGTTLEPPSFLVKRNTTKPVWVGIQSYNKKPGTSRWPTPAEYRMQAYYAIVEGAQGLMWYGGSVTGGMFTNLKESHWDEVQKLVRELKDLDWAWVSPTVEKVEDVADGVPVSMAVKKGPKGTVVVAVNRGDKPVDVVLTPQAKGAAQVVGEGRKVTFSSQGLKEHFDGYGVHVYLIK